MEHRRPAPPPKRPPDRDAVKVIFELTNLCNFSCVHCFRTESKRGTFLPLELVGNVLDGIVRYRSVDLVALTGGEPTLHPRFGDLLDLIVDRGHPFAMVTNGWDLERSFAPILRLRDSVANLTFSLDGAYELTHDAIRRRPGSYRRVMKAVTLCRHHGIPVHLNMVVTRTNRGEVEPMAVLAARLGCEALAFGYCQPTPDAVAAGLVLDVRERFGLEAEVADLAEVFRMEVVLAGDHVSPSPSYRCPQLLLQELNVDYRGRLTACCMLSAYRGGTPDTDVVADLTQLEFADAYSRLLETVTTVHREKLEAARAGEPSVVDRFICTHCLKRYRKVPDLERVLAPEAAPDGQRLAPASNVVLTRLSPTEASLLNLSTRRRFALNETGLRIWELLEGGGSPVMIAHTLSEEYEVDPADAERAVRVFLDQLRGEGLVVAAEE